MSRTNHYRLCGCASTAEPSCWYHLKYGFEDDGWMSYRTFKPTREIAGRRTWIREMRYPKHSPKQWHSGPPRWWWQEQHAKARATYRQMMLRSDDPALPRERDLIDLWGWY